MKTYDVTFIGSGHAAWHAALTLKHAGKEVAIIEKEYCGNMHKLGL